MKRFLFIYLMSNERCRGKLESLSWYQQKTRLNSDVVCGLYQFPNVPFVWLSFGSIQLSSVQFCSFELSSMTLVYHTDDSIPFESGCTANTILSFLEFSIILIKTTKNNPFK